MSRRIRDAAAERLKKRKSWRKGLFAFAVSREAAKALENVGLDGPLPLVLVGDPSEQWEEPDYTEFDEPLRRAFAAFGLDPKKPDNWKILLCFLADIQFGGNRRGRKSNNYWYLWQDYSALKKAHPDATDTWICGQLKKDKDGRFEGRYAELSVDTVRRQLQTARRELGGR